MLNVLEVVNAFKSYPIVKSGHGCTDRQTLIRITSPSGAVLIHLLYVLQVVSFVWGDGTLICIPSPSSDVLGHVLYVFEIVSFGWGDGNTHSHSLSLSGDVLGHVVRARGCLVHSG